MPDNLDQNIKVSSLAIARKVKRKFDAIITIEDPGYRNGLRFHKKPHPDQLILLFEDVDTYELTVALPAIQHIKAAIDFAREYDDGKILIHCKAGVARSTAIALGVISDRLGRGEEKAAVKHLLKIRGEAAPNLIALGMVDDYLGRNGDLVKAWMDVENKYEHYKQHRKLKRDMLIKNPELYRGPFDCLSFSAWRYRPDSLTRERVIEQSPRPRP